MKRHLKVCLLLMMVLVVCVTPVKSLAAKQVEITWTEWWDSEWGNQNMNDLIANFEAQNPDIKINRIYNGWFDCQNKTISLAQAGTPADVMGMEGVWMSSLDKLGALEDLGPWFKKEGATYQNRFVEPAFVKYQGKVKAIYMYVYPFAIAYNENILKQKGLNPPKSLYEFKNQLKNLRNKKSNSYGIALPLSAEASNHIMCIFGLNLAQFGGKYCNADGTAAFNSKAGMKALEFLKSLVDEDLVVPGYMGMTTVQTREFTGSGQIAYTYDGPFIATIVAQRNKNITMAYVPKMKTVTGGYLVCGSGLAMSAKSTHKAEAWKFIKYMMSDQVAAKMVQTTKLPWGVKSVSKLPYVKKDPILSQCSAMVNDPHTILLPVTPESDKIQASFAENIQAAMLGKKTVKAALSDAAAKWNALVKTAK